MTDKPVTLWSMLDDKEQYHYNHIEDGHSVEDAPIPKSPNQVKAWKNQVWRKVHGYLDEDNIVREYPTWRAE